MGTVGGGLREWVCEVGAVRRDNKQCKHDIVMHCTNVSKDESLKRSIRRVSQLIAFIQPLKLMQSQTESRGSNLPASKQHELLMKREKHTPQTLLSTDSRQLGDKLKDPLVHQIHLLLEDADHTKCFLSLYRAAQEGKTRPISDIYRAMPSLWGPPSSRIIGQQEHEIWDPLTLSTISTLWYLCVLEGVYCAAI